ncbi:hypothetical protein SARC_02244 [Sphaeroforma arctica JP610]|uniref:Uncharacterized protein n=1 Tax=Sphaeroforma arctica JP610 TaxID=667725 RepID=A0A0L0G9A1_9EUKA|nr:hypothetical protein SARC_02244 [Sphaeroforma arctica JP610]KNC85587.1 hypothetical protein SARC_02244 [Sphaeroforma arctica JP610]|eukprot:XP_014159489.1 hypothetical protein SARC_02244 [Sphaeroforma arctica JP610]
MEEMFRTVHPGLARRFQMEHAFHFPDYDDLALTKILTKAANESANIAHNTVTNAHSGAVQNMLSTAVLCMQKWLTRERTEALAATVDFGPRPKLSGDMLLLEDFNLEEEEGPDELFLTSLFR